MSRKPSEIYATNAWDFLAQPKVESQWFERKAHPPSQPPRGLRDFVRDRVAPPFVALPTVTRMLVVCLLLALGIRGSYMALIDMGQTMSIPSYPMRTSSMVQLLSTSSSTLHVITALLII